MKKIIGAVVFTMASLSSGYSQDILDVMAREACDCLSKKDFGEIPDKDKITAEVGLCILESYTRHTEDVSKVLSIDELDEEAGRKLGQQIGLKMTKICPDIVIKMGVAGKSSANKDITLEGKISSIEDGDFIFYNLKDKDGKVHRLLWYQHFKGSDEFTDEPKKLVGKKVSVKVKEVECYIPKAKGYYTLKEIVEITLN